MEVNASGKFPVLQELIYYICQDLSESKAIQQKDKQSQRHDVEIGRACESSRLKESLHWIAQGKEKVVELVQHA